MTLPTDKKSRLTRAKELGYTISAYHGTMAKFNEFDMEKGKANHSGFAPFFADDKEEADSYAQSGKTLHVFLRIRKPFYVDSQYAILPKNYKTISDDLYKMITGGVLPTASSRERYQTAADSIEHAMEVHYQETGNYDRKEIWKKIYKRLKDNGYDAIIWKDILSDHSTNPRYQKIAMLDMSGIRSVKAMFDPTKTNSTNIYD